MKNVIRHTLLAFLSVVALISCDSDNGSTAKEEFINSIMGTWTVDKSSTIILDDEDITALLIGFEITISSNLTYQVHGNQLDVEVMPWPATGSFSINDDLTQFTRNDGLVISTNLNDNDDLNLSFQFSEGFDDSEGGRIQAIRGVWHCILKRKL